MQKPSEYLTAKGWKEDLRKTKSNLPINSINDMSNGCMAIGFELLGLAALAQAMMLKYPYERANMDNFVATYGLKMAAVGGLVKLASRYFASPQRQYTTK